MSSGRGKVYIVGAGPGDPELITRKAIRCLRQADVVIYDALVEPIILGKYLSADVRLIDASKRKGCHSLEQPEITELLISEARAGSVVVRLKGGDPFIFGRGSEEAGALADAGIPFEIVPGVSSISAVPGYAGIPLTHRSYSSSFGVYTAHLEQGKHIPDEHWGRIAGGPDTLVFLMGGTRLEEVTTKLIQFGRDPDLSAAVISKGTTPEQVTVTGTLANISDRAQKQGGEMPTLLVVGEVVRLRGQARWFERLPLFGRKVLVTRPLRYWHETAEQIIRLGGIPVECPLVKVKPRANPELVEDLLQKLPDYDWVVFTSRTGAETLLEAAEAAGLDARAFGKARIAAMGPATAAVIRGYHIRVDLIPGKYVSEALAEKLSAQDISDRAVLICSARQARPTLKEKLEQSGARVQVCFLYELVPATGAGREVRTLLEQGRIDYIILTSSLIARTFANLFADVLPAVNRHSKVATIGPVTSNTARGCGIKVWREAEDYTLGGILELMVEDSR